MGDGDFTGSTSTLSGVDLISEANDTGTPIQIYPTSTSGSVTLTHTNTEDSWIMLTGMLGISQNPRGTVNAIGSSELTVTSILGGWTNGKVVTGPAKTITGTVGSVDATGRTVTLSAFTGGWSANTNNYLLGPDISFSDDERFTAQSFKVDIKSTNISTEPITYSAKAIVNAELLTAPETSVIVDTKFRTG